MANETIFLGETTIPYTKQWDESSMVSIPVEWFDTLLTARNKYLVLLNFLFERAELNRDDGISIYCPNVAELLRALEPGRADDVLRKLKMKEAEE